MPAPAMTLPPATEMSACEDVKRSSGRPAIWPRICLTGKTVNGTPQRIGTHMAQQTADHCTDPSEEVIRVRHLTVQFLVTGENRAAGRGL